MAAMTVDPSEYMTCAIVTVCRETYETVLTRVCWEVEGISWAVQQLCVLQCCSKSLFLLACQFCTQFLIYIFFISSVNLSVNKCKFSKCMTLS